MITDYKYLLGIKKLFKHPFRTKVTRHNTKRNCNY